MLRHYIGIAILSILVILTSGIGMSIFGTPIENRKVRYDEVRLRDLGNIKTSVEAYFQDNLGLPSTLEQLVAVRPKTAKPYLKKQPLDPRSKSTYDYKIRSKQQYELCATFETSSEAIQKRKTGVQDLSENYSDSYTQDSSHPAGLHCFSYTIPGYLLERRTTTAPNQYLPQEFPQSTSSAF